MEALDYLEQYLRTATILDVCAFQAPGGAHPKQLLILEGGVGVVAKPADANADAPRMVVREVAAWVFARALGWSDMVAGTVLRRVPSVVTGQDVDASLSVVWPDNQPDVDPGFDDDDVWRAAVFDATIEQSDRSGHNWLAVPNPGSGAPKLKLVDHGYAFYFPGRALGSTFVDRKRGEALPTEASDALDRLLGDWPSELDDLFEDEPDVPMQVKERAEHLASGGVLDV